MGDCVCAVVDVNAAYLVYPERIDQSSGSQSVECDLLEVSPEVAKKTAKELR